MFLAGQTVALIAGSLPWGGTKGKAQSEREKRGPRHSGKSVESSSRRSGGCHPIRPALSGGPAPASKIAVGIGTNSGNRWG